jgi:hypothetical protein
MPKDSLITLIICGALAFFAAGWYAGRWWLEREWTNPVVVVSPADEKRASIEGADPTPAAGTRILRPLPLRRMREAIKKFVAQDPVVMTVGDFGRDDEKAELALRLENRGDCKAVRVAGVAYGYHARGAAVPVNKGGESYLAFDVKDANIDPKSAGQISMPVKNVGVASLAVAHVDLVECEGGKTWKR